VSVQVIETPIAGCLEFVFPVNADERGWFSRAFSAADLTENGFSFEVSQANVALTERAGTVRGMHYQVAPYGEQKFLRCVRGSVFDVVVDVRENSPTFGQWYGAELTPENGHALLIPVGCAHGYLATSDDTQVVYFSDAPYAPDAERILSVRNSTVGIDWPIELTLVSAKDAAADPEAPLAVSGY
jgi:dTDP-4-dehydrorhamnose 3,5-epimerase